MNTYQETITSLAGNLNDEQSRVVISLMQIFTNKQQPSTLAGNTRYKFGLAKGKYVIPDNIDLMNDEIAEMFGVN